MTSSELKALRDEKKELTKNFEDLVDEASVEYQKEVDDLKRDLNRIRDDYERATAEKDRIKDKAEGTTENVFKLESQLREALASIERLNSDKLKLQEDLNEMKQSLSLKENDLRTTLASMQEFQRLASDEKATLRSELRLKDLADASQRTIAERERETAAYREAAVQLEVEKEVRSRAETREEMERAERIAACAQLLATQSDCSNRIRDVEEKSNGVISSLRLDLHALQK
ncbi:unnamed protein product, partial [Symbiodinium microadriaticum]